MIECNQKALFFLVIYVNIFQSRSRSELYERVQMTTIASGEHTHTQILVFTYSVYSMPCLLFLPSPLRQHATVMFTNCDSTRSPSLPSCLRFVLFSCFAFQRLPTLLAQRITFCISFLPIFILSVPPEIWLSADISKTHLHAQFPLFAFQTETAAAAHIHVLESPV